MYGNLPTINPSHSVSYMVSLRKSPKAHKSPKAFHSDQFHSKLSSSAVVSPKNSYHQKSDLNRSASALKLPTIRTQPTLDEIPNTLQTPKKVNLTAKSMGNKLNFESNLVERNYQVSIPHKMSFTKKPVFVRAIKEATNDSILNSAVKTPSQKMITVGKKDTPNNDSRSKNISKEESETEISPTSKQFEQMTSKFVIKKKSNFAISKVTSPKSKLDDRSIDYFASLMKACSKTHGQYCVDEDSISNSQKEIFKWIENNHRTIQLMKYDYIVERPNQIEYQRKYPHKKLLLLDLDETLIHCSGDLSQRSEFDMEIDFVNHEGVPLKGLLNVRPYAREFLQNMSEHYEVVIFTASMKYYADRILRVIDPNKKYISQVFYRESCARTRGEKLVKDLTSFTGINLEDMILVDNNMYCIWPQPQNGIPIINFEFNRSDRELESLEKMLMKLKSGKHCELIKKYFKLEELMACDAVHMYLSLF